MNTAIVLVPVGRTGLNAAASLDRYVIGNVVRGGTAGVAAAVVLAAAAAVIAVVASETVVRRLRRYTPGRLPPAVLPHDGGYADGYADARYAAQRMPAESWELTSNS